jgi:hypothetical protein
MEESQRKSIVAVLGQEEKRNEGCIDIVEVIQNFLKEMTKPDVLDQVSLQPERRKTGASTASRKTYHL